jgi:hypothetical protein
MRPGAPTRFSRFAGPTLILLAAAVAVAPLMLRGNSCGHDFDFHLISWLDAQSCWRLGILYPHWTPSANFGAGEPRFVFYPPLTWMLGAALGFVLPWQLLPVALTFLLLAGTGLATRALARQALSGAAATLSGCAAIFSGYALFCAYERSAFGELTGGFWIPLLLLLILSPHRQRPVCGDPGLRDRNPGSAVWRRALDGSTAPLALVVAGAWPAICWLPWPRPPPCCRNPGPPSCAPLPLPRWEWDWLPSSCFLPHGNSLGPISNWQPLNPGQ